MYHTVKVLRRKGKSLREIASLLSISKTTVQKYLKLNHQEAMKKFSSSIRKSVLFPFEEDYIKIIANNPKLRASKLYRKFSNKHLHIRVSDRTFRNFIRKIKQNTKANKVRYFSVIDYKPGVQMQVDPGEMTVQSRYNEKFKVYFVVFIFSFSKMKYVYFQDKPFNTQDFITAHISCFTHFGFTPKEMIYDQTKLVVINEKYREVWFNQKFYQFISQFDISPYVCEGYDPQSKGLVENAVKEVKHDFLAGEEFLDIEEVKSKSLSWLTEVSERVHSTLRVAPKVLFEEGKRLLKSFEYQVYEERKVDKVGLISWKGNKYSVPYEYQQKKILISLSGNLLEIRNPVTKAIVATHKIVTEKVKPIINNNHYRDYKKILEDLKTELISLLSSYKNHKDFVERLIKENSRNPRDQIRAVRDFHIKYSDLDWNKIISNSLLLSKIRASKIEQIVRKMSDDKRLEKMKEKQDAEEEKKKETEKKNTENKNVKNKNAENEKERNQKGKSGKTSSSTLARDLSYYDQIGASL